MSKFKQIFDQTDNIATASKKRGRPQGKRSNPDYIQVSAYIKKNTYTDVKIALLQTGANEDFSELIELLLRNWLTSDLTINKSSIVSLKNN